MLNWIRRFFSTPVFEDEEKTRVARLTNTMLHIILVSTLLGSAAMFAASPTKFLSDKIFMAAVSIILAATLVMRFMLWRGHVRTISTLLVLILYAIITLSLYSYGGITNATTAGYVLCIIIASLLLGGWATIASLALSIVTIGLAWYGGRANLIAPPQELTPDFDLVANGTIFIMSGVLLYYAVSSLAQAVERARRNERAQIEANRALQALRDSLEQQVADRTHDLERRSAYLEASTEVGRAITSILETKLLLQQVVDLIHERFKFYHVGLFLLDVSGQWAEFRAGTGEVGHVLREQHFRLEVGNESMIGWCTKNAQARVAQDVSQESQRVSHPLLAEARSELALPLIARGRVIGALSTQSTQTGAFDEDTLAVLQTMADQVAVALDNARLFTEAQAALEAERRAYGEISRQAWSSAVRARTLPGYSYINKQIVPINQIESPGQDQAESALALPITVRGAVIGKVNLHKDSSRHKWTDEEITFMQALIDQLGLALDSARLYEDTQRRAAREKLVGEVTTRIRETLDMDLMLKTAAQEIRQAIGLPEVVINLTPPSVHQDVNEQSDKKEPA